MAKTLNPPLRRAKRLKTNKPGVPDITKPWMRKRFKCVDIDPDTLVKPLSRADFMRKPDFPQLPFPGATNVNKNKHRNKG